MHLFCTAENGIWFSKLDASGYFNHDLAMVFLFVCLFPKISVSKACARKPLSPEPHLQTHPPADHSVCWLCSDETEGTCSLPSWGLCHHSRPCQLHLKLSKDHVFPLLLFKGSVLKLGKPKGKVKVTAWRKGNKLPYRNESHHHCTCCLTYDPQSAKWEQLECVQRETER